MSKKHRERGIAKIEGSLPEFEGIVWDMHTHLDMVVRYSEQYPPIPTVSQLVRDSINAGVSGFLHCACELDDIKAISGVLDQIETVENAQTRGAIAIHPNEAVLHAAGKGGQTELLKVAADGLEPPKLKARHLENDIDDCLALIEGKFKDDPRIRVIGETGLDYFRSHPEAKGVQQNSFRKHIELAKSLGLPVQIHDRNAHEDVVQILSELKPEKALFHSFSGDVELAQVAVKNGYYCSFSGPITFKPNQDLREAFKFLFEHAPELLLVETDAPFLTPEPNRGRTNSPAQIFHTVNFMAELVNVPVAKLAQQLSDNSCAILN